MALHPGHIQYSPWFVAYVVSCFSINFWKVQNLSYNEHVTTTVSDCMHRLIRINRIKLLLDRKTLLSIINAFVFSKLFHCSTAWSNTSKTNVKKLQLVQNVAGRIVLGSVITSLRDRSHLDGFLLLIKYF